MFQTENDQSEGHFENYSPETTVPVFDVDPQTGEPIISTQPNARNEDRRRPIPISTIDSTGTNTVQFIADTGIDFLRHVELVYIQQTVELSDLLQHESENRYTIKIPRGDTLYYGCEISSSSQRLFCGSNRSFSLRLFDRTQQEALHFKRRFACGLCSIWCYLQYLEVWAPPGDYLGAIKQEFSMSVPTFVVKNGHGSIIYRIEGPPMCGCFMMGKEAHFKIYTGDGMTQLGSINHHWDSVQASYNLCLQFPNRNTDPKHKSLLLGAAFLLEYMFFVNAKKTGNCKFC